MKQKERQLIEQTINIIDKISISDEKLCSLVIETGYDEAIILGTESVYLELALNILKFVKSAISHEYNNTDLREQFVDGDIAIVSKFIAKNFNELADVWPVCA